MVAKHENKTEMISSDTQKMIRMRANRPLSIPQVENKIFLHNEEFETDEETAKMLEKSIKGHYSFFGTRFSSAAERFQYQRAVRI